MFFPHWGPRPPSQRYHYPEFGGLSLIHIIMYTYITIHNYICMYAYTAYCLLLLVFEFKKNDIMLVYSLPGFFFFTHHFKSHRRWMKSQLSLVHGGIPLHCMTMWQFMETFFCRLARAQSRIAD